MSKWKPIETAPRCVASSPGGCGKRAVLVTRWPIVTGRHPPMVVARLTGRGWMSGRRYARLWFVPTHWMPLPEPPNEVNL